MKSEIFILKKLQMIFDYKNILMRKIYAKISII